MNKYELPTTLELAHQIILQQWDLLDSISKQVQILKEENANFIKQIQEQAKKIQELTARLNQNSKNSSKPPSLDQKPNG